MAAASGESLKAAQERIARLQRQTLSLRIKAEERDLIDRAAVAKGMNRTEFILDATRRAAAETRLDRALLRVGGDAFAAFQARLDEPPRPNARLRKTMQGVPPWETP